MKCIRRKEITSPLWCRSRLKVVRVIVWLNDYNPIVPKNGKILRVRYQQDQVLLLELNRTTRSRILILQEQLAVLCTTLLLSVAVILQYLLNSSLNEQQQQQQTVSSFHPSFH